MKLLLLHGPAISSSRKKLIELKKVFTDNVTTFEKGSDTSQILETLRTVPMFDGERLVIVENGSDEILEKVVTIDYELLTIILWFDHEIDSKNFPKAERLFFPEAKEVSVFPWLRQLGARNNQAFSELIKLKEAGFENQYFITMILYLLRNLVATPKKTADFVKQNNERMRKNFTNKELINLYKEILTLDFKLKKGLLEPDQADFFLVSKFLRNYF